MFLSFPDQLDDSKYDIQETKDEKTTYTMNDEELSGMAKNAAILFSGFTIGLVGSQDGRCILGGAASAALTSLTWKYTTGEYITNTNMGTIGLMAAAVTGTVASIGLRR